MSAGLGEGRSSPLGATPSPSGVNFSVFSRHATGVELLLFEGSEDKAARVLRLDPTVNAVDPTSDPGEDVGANLHESRAARKVGSPAASAFTYTRQNVIYNLR